MTFESDDIVDTGATENTAAEVETEQTEEWQPEQPNEAELEAKKLEEEQAKQEAEQESKKKNRKLIYIVRNIDRMVLTRMRSMGWILQGRF